MFLRFRTVRIVGFEAWAVAVECLRDVLQGDQVACNMIVGLQDLVVALWIGRGLRHDSRTGPGLYGTCAMRLWGGTTYLGIAEFASWQYVRLL